MKLRFEQLGGHLESQLAPLYIVCGDEPWQLGEASQQIRAQARARGYTDRQVMYVETGFNWDELLAVSSALSLFSERRLIELRLPSGKPGDKGAKALIAYTQQLPEDTVLLLVCGKLEAAQLRSKWLTTLEKHGVLLQVWPLEMTHLPRWIRQRLQQRALQATEAAVDLLAERVEGNLLAADQEMEKLRLLYGPGALDENQVAAAVADSARFDVFALVDVALQGDVARAARIVFGLRGEGVAPPLVLWALVRELRTLAAVANIMQSGVSLEQAMEQQRVWNKRKALVRGALQRSGTARWQAMLWQAWEVDKVIKGMAPGKPWDELLQLTMKLSGRGLSRHFTLSR